MAKAGSIYFNDSVLAWFNTRKEKFNRSEFVNDAVEEKVLRDTGVAVSSDGSLDKLKGLTKVRASDGSHYYV